MKKQIISLLKSIGFVLFIHAVTVLSTVLMLDITSDSYQKCALVFFCLALIILAPSYFYIKGKNSTRAKKPYLTKYMHPLPQGSNTSKTASARCTVKKTFPHEEGVIVKYAPRFGPAETYINTGLEFE